MEDGCISGGFGSAILEFISAQNYTTKVKMLGIPDRFINHGSQEELYKECLYDTKSIIECVLSVLKTKSMSQVG